MIFAEVWIKWENETLEDWRGKFYVKGAVSAKALKWEQAQLLKEHKGDQYDKARMSERRVEDKDGARIFVAGTPHPHPHTQIIGKDPS